MSSRRHDTLFVCQNCGFQSLRWLGRCPECGEWNAFVEKTDTSPSTRAKIPSSAPLPIPQISSAESTRIKTEISEFDRVLGGGIVSGSCVLIAGEPGIGKSTLLLQAANAIARQGKKILYISGEEAPTQLKIRADRISANSQNLIVSFQSEIGEILALIENTDPDLVIVDSIQAVFLEELPASAGSVIQVRESASRLFSAIKSKRTPLILVGHVTKEGSIAGPKLLEHLVDVVLYFEGDRTGPTRILRSQKNRFGDTTEIGIFQMTSEGLRETAEDEQLFLDRKAIYTPGNVVAAILEGARVILAGVQALAAHSYLAIPRRVANGFDYNRLLVILAILEKTANLRFGQRDVYVNVLGGLRVDDPACDLALAIALYSSLEDLSLPPTVAFGELGLGGEIRLVPALEKRILHAQRLGFQVILTPSHKGWEEMENVQAAENIREVLSIIRKISRREKVSDE
ncbi:MAG: DNA repair protein RadA [bacterium]